mgnify:CR=1 FL=1
MNILGLINLKNLIAFGTMPYRFRMDPDFAKAYEAAARERLGDLDGAVTLQAGRLADMNFVAERLTGLKTAE